MPWVDRVREAAYTPPGGDRLRFSFEDVSKSFDKKTTAFEFPDADGTYVQDTGATGRRVPLRLYFWGDDYDIEAEAFEAGLRVTGTGKLEHPMYGVLDVVPFGTITRRDDLKTAANQAVIELTFWETTGLIYPSAQIDPAKEVLAAVEECNDAAALEFEDVLDISTAVDEVILQSNFETLLSTVDTGLSAIAGVQDNVIRQFNNISDSITQGISVLIETPAVLASQVIQLIQTPARIFAGLKSGVSFFTGLVENAFTGGDRLRAYGDLLETIFSSDDPVSSKSIDSKPRIVFHVRDLYARSYVSGSVVSVVNTQFITKTEALEAAEIILAQLASVVAWRDENFQALEEIDTGASYQKLQESVALAAGFLVEISFSLKQERWIVLDRSRTIIDLSAELYGSVDDKLDFLISSNGLSGSEILELPRGKEIVYYI